MKGELKKSMIKSGNMLLIGLLVTSSSGCFRNMPNKILTTETSIPLELPDTTKLTVRPILQEEPMVELGLNSKSSGSSTEWPEDFKDSLPFHIEGEPIDAPGSEWYSGRKLEPDNPLEEEQVIEEWSEDADTVNLAPDGFSYETEVSDPIPPFILNEGFGGFMGFQVRVIQDSETGNLSVTGTKWLPVFTGSFLLVLDSADGECAVIEIPAMLINQYEHFFELEIIPHEQFPNFVSFRFLTNYHIQYSEFEPLISATTERWFSVNVRHDQLYEVSQELTLPAGWLTLSNFTYMPEQNAWFVQASWDTEGVEQRSMDILFLDGDRNVLLELGVNPQFHIFEPGEVRWLNASNDEDLNLVRYVAVEFK